MWEEEVCVICQGGIGNEEVYRLECNHAFHVGCIVSNLQAGNVSCPTCRRLPEGVIESSFAYQRESDIHRADRMRRENDLVEANKEARKKNPPKMVAIAFRKLRKAKEMREKEKERDRIARSVRIKIRRIKRQEKKKAVSKAKKEAEAKAKVMAKALLSSYGMSRVPHRHRGFQEYRVRACEDELISAYRVSMGPS